MKLYSRKRKDCAGQLKSGDYNSDIRRREEKKRRKEKDNESDNTTKCNQKSSTRN